MDLGTHNPTTHGLLKIRFRIFIRLFASFGLVAGLVSTMPVAAQEVDLQRLSPGEANAPGKTDGGLDIEVIHVTDRLTNSAEGQEALLNYIEAREAGLLTAGKGGAAYDLGDEKSFNVLDAIQTDEPTWKTLTFVLRSTNNVANVWIDKTLDDQFSDENLSALDEQMLRTTPAGSFRPDRGIIENNNYLFGNPPNYDGDGKVDILLYDIAEGKAGSCCVLGYVTSSDINPRAKEGEGNQADVLYVDLPDGIKGGISYIAWIVSHEYQHLIHYAYQDPPGTELTFVNEGLSEWASVINGYLQRSIRYFGDASEHSTPLLDWNTSQNVYDYERASLFTTYIAQHIGPEETGSIVQARKPADLGGSFAIGDEGYRTVLEANGISLASVIAGFHTANFVNDRSIDPQYGYELSRRSTLKTVPTTSIDGTSRNRYSKSDFLVNPGAVHYFTWSQVANMSIRGDVPSYTPEQLRPGYRKRFELRAYLEPVEGPPTIETLIPGEETYAFPGDFSSVTLIVVNTAPYKAPDQNGNYSTARRFDVNSSWDEAGSSGQIRQTVSYEDGTAAGTDFYYTGTKEAMLANKFRVPENGRLASVFFAPVYDNDFGNSDVPAGAPRDFRVHVWHVDAGGNPGQEVYSTDVVESASTRHIDFGTKEFSFLEVELPDSSIFEQLGDSVFVGVSNLGADENFLALTPAVRTVDDVLSYLYLNFNNGAGWASFSSITVQDEPVFEDKVHPIRADFITATSTASDAPTELPEQVTLSQNYPNPFNPSTSVTFSLPKTMQVRLAVYDALGRRVATPVDGVQAAGSHSVQLDAGGWASGVYFYTLETEAQTVSKHMVLMK